MFKAKERAEELFKTINYINIKGNKNSVIWIKQNESERKEADVSMMKHKKSTLYENNLDELSNNWDKREMEETINLRIKISSIILAILIIFATIFGLNKDNLIIDIGIRFYNILNMLFRTGCLIVGIFIGVNLFMKYKINKIPDKCKPIKSNSTPLKEKDINRENISNKLDELRSTWVKGDEEQRQSVKYFAIAQEQLKQIVTVQDTLRTLTNSKEEESLNEVFNTLSKVEDQMLKNIYGMLNHIYLECSIDGYDTTNIEEYLEANEKMIEESSKLLKASLLYMDGKSGSKGIDEYIKSMVETLKKLKKDM